MNEQYENGGQRTTRKRRVARRLSALLSAMLLVCMASGCEPQKRKEMCMQVCYRTAEAYLRQEEPVTADRNPVMKMVLSKEDYSNFICGSFDRDGREIRMYCLGTKDGEDPVASTYVSELKESQVKEIFGALSPETPKGCVPKAVRAGKMTYLPVKVIPQTARTSSPEILDTADSFDYCINAEMPFAARCLPAGLSAERLSEKVIQPSFPDLTQAKMELDRHDPKAVALLKEMTPDDDVRNLSSDAGNIGNTDPEEAFLLKDFAEYSKATWRDMLLLEVTLTGGSFEEREAELVAWVQTLGVAGVTFCDDAGANPRTVFRNEMHQLQFSDGETRYFRYPVYEVFSGDDPDAAAKADGIRYYQAQTLEPVEFYQEPADGMIHARHPRAKADAPSSDVNAE